MVMSWLINSMNNDIGENFILYEMTQEINLGSNKGDLFRYRRHNRVI